MAGLASMALGDAYVDIMGNTNKLASDLARAQGMVSGFVGDVGKTLVAGIGAAFLTAGGVVAASFKSWMDEERSIFEMSTAFESVGMNAGKMTAKISGLADTLMRLTTLTDDSVRAMSTQAAQMGVNEKNMEEFIKAAIGLGKQSGRSPEMIMRPLILASQGYSQIMLRLFPQLRSVASEQERWNMIMQLSKQGMLAASRETNTLSGAFKQLRNAFGEALDSLGKGLFEKSGLNKEIKKVTDSVFAIVDALDQGFSTKAFKGFNFEGLGDWISNLLIKFTAMLMTLPDAFRALKDIFSDPDKLLYALGESLKSVAKIFMTTIIEGFSALTSIFEGLGKVIYTAFAAGLENIPFLRVPLIEQRRQTLQGMSDKQIEKLFLKSLPAQQEFEKIFPTTFGLMWEKVKSGDKPTRQALIEALAAKGGEVVDKEAMAGVMASGVAQAKSSIPKLLESIGKVVEEEKKKMGGIITDVTGVDFYAKFQGFVDQITALYGIESKKGGSAQRLKRIGKGGGIDMGGGVADKASFSIISMSDQWKKMQEGITKNKDEKEIREATKKTASWTEQTAKGVQVLVQKFGGKDSNTPLFEEGN